MTKRMWVLLACLGLVAILALVYVYLAFAPTGYKKFREERLAAIEKTLESIELPRMEVEVPEKTVFSEPTRPAVHVNEESYRKAATLPEQAMWIGKVSQQAQINYWEIRMPSLRLSSKFLSEDAFESAADAQSIRLKEPELQEVTQIKRYWDKDASLQTKKRAFNRILDKIDSTLLDTSWEWEASSYDWGFLEYSNLAIARAAIRGEAGKAAVLMERFVRIVRAAQMKTLSTPNSPTPLNNWLATVITLVEMNLLTSEHLLPAQQFLERTILSKDQIESLRLKRAFNIRDNKIQNIEHAHKVMTTDTWYILPKWTYEKIVPPLLKPILARQTEKAVMAWAEGNEQKAVKMEKRLTATCQLMQIHPRVNPVFIYYDSYGFRFEAAESLSGDILRNTEFWKMLRSAMDAANGLYGYQDEIRLAVLGLATARYRADHGKYPHSIDSLMPDYLEASLFNEGTNDEGKNRRATWAVYVLQAQDFLIFSNSDMWGQFHEAVYSYTEQYGEQPDGVDDLLPYVEDKKKLNSFACQVMHLPSRPVLCVFRPDVYNFELLANLSEYGRNDQGLRKYIEEQRQVFADKNERPERYFAQFIYLYYPSIPHQTLQLLKRNLDASGPERTSKHND